MALGDRHPDAERLGEYAEGALTAAERTAVERHLVDCEECRAVLADAVTFLDEDEGTAAPAADVRPFPRRRWVMGVAATLAAAAALVLAIRGVWPEWLSGIFGPRTERPELRELIAAVALEPRRPIDGRFAGGFTYAPAPLSTRGPDDRRASPETRIALENLERSVRDRATAPMKGAFGVALIVSGSTDAGIRNLEEAVALEPTNPALFNDLAVGYLNRAKFGGPDDLARAREAVDRGRALDPRRPELAFNLAMILESLQMREEAVKAWRAYLALDASSEWAAEARSRVFSLAPGDSR